MKARRSRRAWQQALARATRLAQRFSQVTGVDHGYVYREGRRTAELGIRFHVTHKLPPAVLAEHDTLPREIDGVPCDVVQAAYGPHGRSDACDPLQPGISIGNIERARQGTLGMFVRDRATGRPGLLSNWHVLAGATDGAPGDAISQPGPRHLGSAPARVVARLERWLDLATGCDAAFALLEGGAGTAQRLFGGTIAITGVEAPRPGMELVKVGVTTGLTHGLIDGSAGSFRLDYSAYGDTTRWMDGFRLVPHPDHPVDEISLAGDSGAVWVNPVTRRAVGLHFAGEDGVGPLAEYALAHPIARVLELAGLRLP